MCQYTHPFDFIINKANFAKMTTFKPAPGIASTQVNERISISAILRGAYMGCHAKIKNHPLATLYNQEMTKNLLLFIYRGS